MNEKILIIEDEADIRVAMADVMESANYTVMTAENGAIGLEIALKEKPNLILLDLRMPEMDGHETLKRLRQNPWGKDAKVVILSAMDDVQNIGTAFEGQISDYIIKAHNSVDEILNKVRESLYTN
ncbi:MAG: response regulator [Okeania sp. SIO3H1]|nr:response regulator [Okeania sp. SIO3H1]